MWQVRQKVVSDFVFTYENTRTTLINPVFDMQRFLFGLKDHLKSVFFVRLCYRYHPGNRNHMSRMKGIYMRENHTEVHLAPSQRERLQKATKFPDSLSLVFLYLCSLD